VHKPVDNEGDVRITDLRFVDNVWMQKKLEMNSRRLLRDTHGGSRNTFTVGNGHHPGETPGREKDRETGV
jgi:hypothetical protein